MLESPRGRDKGMVHRLVGKSGAMTVICYRLHNLIFVAMISTNSTSSPMLRQLLNGVNLTKTFDEIDSRSQKTKGATLREKLLKPKLTTVSFTNNKALDKEVQDFLAENGDIPASKDMINMFAALHAREIILIAKKKRLGHMKQTSAVP